MGTGEIRSSVMRSNYASRALERRRQRRWRWRPRTIGTESANAVLRLRLRSLIIRRIPLISCTLNRVQITQSETQYPPYEGPFFDSGKYLYFLSNLLQSILFIFSFHFLRILLLKSTFHVFWDQLFL